MKKIMLKSAAAIIAVYLGFTSPVNAQWTTSGTNIRNSNTGNVGINTSTATPSKRLQVHSATSRDQMYISGTTPSIFLGDNTSIASATKMGTVSMTTEANMFGFGTASGDLVMSSKTGKLHFITGGSVNTSGKVRMTVDMGKISMGTTTDPLTLETIGGENDGTNAALRVISGSQTMLLDGNEIDGLTSLYLNSNSKKNVLICANGGNVGIGTSSPTSTFEITGMHTTNVSDASLKIKSGTRTMLLDGDDIDALSTLNLNYYSKNDVTLCAFGGNVGIGTAVPNSTLHLKGMENDGTNSALKIESATHRMLLDGNEIDALVGGLYLNRNSNLKVILCQNGGAVGIGTETPSSAYKLSVNGGIRAKEIVVETAWSDFVFEKDYKLKSLKEIEDFINKNGHLPEIPNAEEVAQNGIKVGEIQSKLLMKIEELTLYIIKQEKRMNELENQLKNNN